MKSVVSRRDRDGRDEEQNRADQAEYELAEGMAGKDDDPERGGQDDGPSADRPAPGSPTCDRIRGHGQPEAGESDDPRVGGAREHYVQGIRLGEVEEAVDVIAHPPDPVGPGTSADHG